jgi:hypothetical protein
MKPSANRTNYPAIFLAAVIVSGVFGCASQAVSDVRSTGLQNRQDRMNERTYSRADRRQIRSENADARSDALFNAL